MWQIRPATLDDAPEVVRVFMASRLEALPYLPKLHTEEDIVKGFRRVVFPKNTVWIAEDSPGGVVGFIAFGDEFVNHLYLLSAAQRQGIGSALLNIAQQHSSFLKLWTFQRNIAALRFYAKHGFRIADRTDGADNEEREPDVLMEWRAPSEIKIVSYDPTWVDTFASLRKRIWPKVGDVAVSIEHVGSTSVPGLAAKPIIDIDVVVSSEDDVRLAIARLETLDYVQLGDLGIPDREALATPVNTPRHHLYVCLENSVALANHLTLRDYLRGNPQAVENYGALKRRLARESPNHIDAYCEAKTDFITGILATRGCSADALNTIRSQNKVP